MHIGAVDKSQKPAETGNSHDGEDASPSGMKLSLNSGFLRKIVRCRGLHFPAARFLSGILGRSDLLSPSDGKIRG